LTLIELLEFPVAPFEVKKYVLNILLNLALSGGEDEFLEENNAMDVDLEGDYEKMDVLKLPCPGFCSIENPGTYLK